MDAKQHGHRLLILLVAGMGAFGCARFAGDGGDASVAAAADANAPDYALGKNWVWHAMGGDRPVDLFLVCPTVDMRDETNLSLGDEETKAAFRGALAMERKIYEDSARLFAPYYRQAAMKAYALPAADRETALALAYRGENLGACFTDYAGAIEREVPALCGAWLDTERGVVKVTDVSPSDYPPIVPGLPVGAYHVYDYLFFFRNLQENVRLRTASYLSAGGN